MRQLLAVVALCCALASSPSRAEPYTINDLLDAETLVTTLASPDGRWVVVQTYAGQAHAPRFDYDAAYYLATSRLRIIDLTKAAPAAFLIPPDRNTGFVPGPFSPSGQRMLVHRVRDHHWETGVIDLVSRKVRWFGLGVDFSVQGRTAVWRGETEIIAITHPTDRPHLLLRRRSEPPATLAARWRATAIDGGPSATMIGSGRFLSRGGSNIPATLVRLDVETGEASSLAKGDFLYLELAPNGRYVAAVKEGADIQPSALEPVTGGTAMRRRDLVVGDLETKQVLAPCPACDLSPFLLSWAPGGDRLLIHARRPGQAVQDGRLAVISPARAGADTVSWLLGFRPAMGRTNEGFELIQAGWLADLPVAWGAPDDASPSVASAWWRLRGAGPIAPLPAGAEKAARLYQTPGEDLLALDGDRLLAIDARSGQAKPVLEGFTPIRAPSSQISGLDFARAGPEPNLVGVAKGRLVRVASAKVEDFGPAPVGLNLITARGAAVTLERDDHGVQTLSIVDHGQRRAAAVLNPQFATRDLNLVKPVKHRAPDGLEVTSWLMLPPEWKPGDRPPIVVVPYPSRSHFSPSKPPSDLLPGLAVTNISAQLIAARGYAVLYPSLVRSPTDDPGEGMASAILTAVDAVGAVGLADADRVALWGHSFGGYIVLSAATQSPRFKAVIASAGITDPFSAWGQVRGNAARTRPEEGFVFNAGTGYLETGQMRVGAPPWVAPHRYIRASPYLNADRITAPVLLIYGDLDGYGATQGEEMFSAFYRLGKDAKLLTFWGEGHVVLAPENIRRLYAESFAFLDQALDVPVPEANKP